MDQLLLQLLVSLESIGDTHEELYDTEVRQRIGDAVFYGFVRRREDYHLPTDFGMYSVEANHQVRLCLNDFLQLANEVADRDGLSQFQDRLRAIQNTELATPGQGNRYDDFLGYTDPKEFDEHGERINME